MCTALKTSYYPCTFVSVAWLNATYGHSCVAGAVLDRDSSNMAVRLAVGETTLLAENKEFFDKEGVDLRALEGQTG